MSDIPSARQKIQVEATRFRAAVSESLAQDMGAAINYLIDERDTLRAEVSAIEAAGDTQTMSGTTWVGSQNIFSITRTFAANESWSVEFTTGNWGSTTYLGGGTPDFATFSAIFHAPFGTGLLYSLQLYNDAALVASSPTTVGELYMPTSRRFYTPGAGTHTVRLYLNVSGSFGVTFDGQITFTVHKHL